MDHISSALAPSTPTAITSIEPLPTRWVAKLFERLAGQLGSKMANLYAGVKPEVVQAEWAAGLAGFTPEEIARGISACQHRQFAPNIGEFSHLCRPTLDAEIAWNEAEAGLAARERGEVGVWSHPAVWRAATLFWQEIRGGEFRRCRNRWDHVLRTEFAKGWMEDVPAVPLRVEHKPTLRPMPPEIRAKLASMGISLKFKRAAE